MSLRATNRVYNNLVGTLGKGVLAALFPKDFEVYMMALELVDYRDRTIDYFAFPIMPESITKVEPKRTNIKKSSSGTTVLTSNSFVPEDLIIKGNFGRTFKILLSPKAPAVQGVAFSTVKGKYDLLGTKVRSLGLATKDFTIGIKTGYGAHSILRAIINKSNGVDGAGRPFKLYFYNMAIGESYLVAVPPSGFTSSQTREKNMIWDYTLNLTVLAPLDAVRSARKKTSMLLLLGFSVLGAGIAAALKEVKNQLKSAT